MDGAHDEDLPPDFPGTYSRSVVPDALARKAIELESRRRVVEDAIKIWKKRSAVLTKSDREIYLAYRNPERRHSGPLCTSAFQDILFQMDEFYCYNSLDARNARHRE